jgi:hypothetical protein
MPVIALTVKLYVNELPGKIPHCDTATGPSICVVPFWYKPWKCRLVLSLPSEFFTLTTTRSPFVATIVGTGHWPLTPMTGRVCCPSGFAYVQPMSKSYVTVAQWAMELRRDIGRRKFDKESAMVGEGGWQKLELVSLHQALASVIYRGDHNEE